MNKYEKKPWGYWTKEKCAEIALKYNDRSEFYKNEFNVYDRIYRHGWYDELCSHMLIEHAHIWTKEKCLEVSSKYKSKKDLRLNNETVYNKMRKNGWLGDIKNLINAPNYWTREQCFDESLKYNNLRDFRLNSTTVYVKMRNNGWLMDLNYFIPIAKPLTKEDCLKEALKYSSRKEFKENSRKIYNLSERNIWIFEICSHMPINGNLKKRMVYAYEFSDNFVYIGLTGNDKRRTNDHLLADSDSAVNKHMVKTNLFPTKKIISDYIDVRSAQQLERDTIKKYKNENWFVLNINSGGELGGNTIKWTKERCEIEAKKYETRNDFNINSKSAYSAAYKNKWLDSVCKHMKVFLHYYTKDDCHAEALKYKYRNDFAKKSKNLYFKALRNGWLDDVCTHMVPKTKKNTL